MIGPVFHHRVSALVASLLSSCALSLLAVAGTTCSFLTVSARDGQLLVTDVPEEEISSHDIGILCDSDYFEVDDDIFSTLSEAFVIVSLVLGSLCTTFAWALSFVVPPTDSNWKALSVASALSAVLQVPVFLLFESEPCTDYDGQHCTVSLGVFLLICSTTFWVAVTLLTQCVDPPRWSIELDAWKVQKRNEAVNVHATTDNEDGMEEFLIMQQFSTRKAKSFGRLGGAARQWFRRRRWAYSPGLPLAATESASHEEEAQAGAADADFPEAPSYYANSDNSRLVLKVTSDGKLVGDDQKSVATFGDLDELVKLAETRPVPPSSSSSHFSSPDSDLLMGEDLMLSDQENSLGMEGLVESAKEDTKKTSFAERNVESMIRTSIEDYHSLNLSGDGLVSSKQDEHALPSEESRRGNIIAGIRALTVRMKRDVSRRMNNANNGLQYAAVASDSGKSQSTVTGSSGENQMQSKNSFMEAGAVGSSEVVSQVPGNGQLISDWNALFADSSPHVTVDPVEHSSGEDDPEDVFCSSEGTTSLSMRSFGAATDDFGEDESSSVSSSSMTETSDSDVQRLASSRSLQIRGRPRGRQRRRTRSAGNSIASRTSLLDTTIDEETDLDLEEFESDTEEYGKTFVDTESSTATFTDHIPLTRTKSAPEFGLLDSELSSSWMPASDCYSFSGCENRLQQGQPTTYSSPPVTVFRRDESTPSGETESEDFGLQDVVPSKKCKRHHGSLRNRRRCRSLSIHRRSRRSSSVFKDGIHSPLVGLVSDEDSTDTGDSGSSNENRSAVTTLSYQARLARIRRLNGETEDIHRRRRSRTLDPPRHRWHTDRKEPAGFEDYGSDEASL